MSAEARAAVAGLPGRAVHRVLALVHRLAVTELGGVEATVPTGASRVVRRGLADPLVGVRAARLVRDVAVLALDEAALEARAAGAPWEDVGVALGFPPAGRSGRSLALRAFLAVEMSQAGGAPPASPCVWFTCRACLLLVTDYGPDERWPDEREAGHAPQCPRRLAALAAAEHDDPGSSGGSGATS